MDAETRLRRLAMKQHAVVAITQAHDVGMSPDQTKRLVASGRWIRTRWGALAVAGAPPTYEQAVMAAALAAGDGAVVSHLTAARLWGLLLPSPDAIDVLTNGTHRVRLRGVRHHRTNLLPTADVTRHRGIPITTAARVLCDCAGLLPPKQLALAIDDARRRKLVSLERLRACHQRLDTGAGRRSMSVMRQMLAARKPGSDPGASDRERWVGDVLEAAGLARPVPRYKIRVGNKKYELDHAYPELLVAAEFDGWDTHGSYSAFHADRKRWRILQAAGWRIAVFTSHTTREELVADVTALCELAARERTA